MVGRNDRGNLKKQSNRLVIGILPTYSCNNKRSIDRDSLNPHYPGHKKITKRVCCGKSEDLRNFQG